jgi:hypothetical protein
VSDRVQPEFYDAGVEYLQRVNLLLPTSLKILFLPKPKGYHSGIDRRGDPPAIRRERISICSWIGKSITTVNQRLQSGVNVCHECFNFSDRRSIQIFAVPFAPSVRLDGVCNISIAPTTILVDIGRVAPSDWLALIAHEYAHAHLGYPGHDRAFARTLTHLCLGLGLPQPPATESNESLYYWPPYQPTLDPLAFWRGE